MSKKNKPSPETLKKDVHRLAGIHYFFIASYAVTIIFLHAWKVITLETVYNRWVSVGLLGVLVTVVWYLSSSVAKSSRHLVLLIYALVVVDIIFASWNVYTERGMASKSVILFALPIAVAGVLRQRSAIYTASVLSVIGYTTAVIKYYYIYPGEGYYAQMYVESLFYCLLFFVIGAVLGVIVHAKN